MEIVFKELEPSRKHRSQIIRNIIGAFIKCNEVETACYESTQWRLEIVRDKEREKGGDWMELTWGGDSF